MFDKLQGVEGRYEELGELLSDPEVISDTKRLMALTKEESQLRETVEVYRRYKVVVNDIADTEEMLGENLDSDMAEMAKEELSDLKKEKEQIEEKSKFYYCQKTKMTIKILSWKFVAQLVAMKQPYLQEIYLGCTKNMQKAKAGKPKCWKRISQESVVIKRLSL